MKLLNAVPCASALLMLAGCGLLPNENTSNRPMSIRADGDQYFTCKSFTVEADHSIAGETAYNLDFDQAGTNTKVILKNVKKLTMEEMPSMVDGPMPISLPDLQTDKDRDGKAYQEGSVYTFSDGNEAQVKAGKWVAVKVSNKVCEAG